MRSSSLWVTATVFAAASSAWPWSFREPVEAADQQIHAEPLLVERQDPTKTSFNLSFSASSTAEDSPTDTPTDASSTNSDNTSTLSDLPSSTGTGTGTRATTGTASQSGTNTRSTRRSGTTTAPKSYDARLPAGGVSMITPNAMSPASYYKIKDYVTFAWNYTSLSATPSYIDILASCSANQATYTIAMNQTFQPTQTILWDTGAYQSSADIPLLTEKYTLIIHDAAKEVTAAPAAGYLGTYSQFTFGMYSPQAYTPLSDYVCATCNGAMTQMEKHTLGFLFGMVAVTVLSFGWFAGVAGIC